MLKRGYFFNDQHRMLQDFIYRLLCEEGATVVNAETDSQPSKVMPAPTFHIHKDVWRLEVEFLAEIRPKLFWYSNTELVGVQCNLECVDMETSQYFWNWTKFPANFYLCGLQRAFHNDKNHTGLCALGFCPHPLQWSDCSKSSTMIIVLWNAMIYLKKI